MSQGKYSPCLPKQTEGFIFNCYKQLPSPWNLSLKEAGVVYDDKTMFGNYDIEGFDSYGYSAFTALGEFVGHGAGVDRLGYTENDYLCMSQEEFLDCL